MCKEATIIVLFFLLLVTGVGSNKFDFYPVFVKVDVNMMNLKACTD